MMGEADWAYPIAGERLKEMGEGLSGNLLGGWAAPPILEVLVPRRRGDCNLVAS